MISDFPIAPPIRVKDSPRERRLETLEDARSSVNDALAARRTAPWREHHARLKEVKSEDDAIQAIGALRELLVMEGLLQSSQAEFSGEFAKVILRLEPLPVRVVGQFDCGSVPGWKIDGPKGIFPGWRQLCNAIAAPSTDALKRSSWYRRRVTRSARSAELL